MNPFEMVVLIVAIVVAGRVIATRYGRASAPGGLASSSSPAEVEELRAEIRRLKDRVAVLERLATDDTTRLEQEIEKLRDQP